MSQKKCAKALAVEGVFTKISERISKYASKRQNPKIFNFLSIHLFSRKLFGSRIQRIFDPFLIMLPQVDFLKDMILVVRLITLLGGIIVVFKNPQLFSSIVSTIVYITWFSFSQYPLFRWSICCLEQFSFHNTLGPYAMLHQILQNWMTSAKLPFQSLSFCFPLCFHTSSNSWICIWNSSYDFYQVTKLTSKLKRTLNGCSIDTSS